MRIISFAILSLGVILSFYIFYPLLSWQIYFVPVFATSNIESPIPRSTVLTPSTLKSLVSQARDSLSFVDYTNAQNWFPNFKTTGVAPKVATYKLSIPKIGIKDALVSTSDYDLSKHLVNYAGTSIAPQKGNAVILGHSTLPQLFREKDYKTIFANLHTLEVDDKIIAIVDDVSYTYQILSITVVDPKDTSAFSQDYNDSYLTLITCTPPGTVWKRLIIKARIASI